MVMMDLQLLTQPYEPEVPYYFVHSTYATLRPLEFYSASPYPYESPPTVTPAGSSSSSEPSIPTMPHDCVDIQQKLQSYSSAVTALEVSNSNLSKKMEQLTTNIKKMTRELSNLHSGIKSVQHPCLVTWEADILTKLIDVAYSKIGKGLQTIMKHQKHSRDMVTRAYVVAAVKIPRCVLKDQLGLSRRYHLYLARYKEVAEFRSENPIDTAEDFARWLLRKKEDMSSLYGFWAKLFPICYNRKVEEYAAGVQ